MADIGTIIDENASRALAPAAVGSQVALMSIVSVGRFHPRTCPCHASTIAGSYGGGIQRLKAQEQGMALLQPHLIASSHQSDLGDL